MMPLKYLKELDCWNLLSMVAMQSFLAIAAATARNDPPHLLTGHGPLRTFRNTKLNSAAGS